MDENYIKKIKDSTEEFLNKMTISDFTVEAQLFPIKNEKTLQPENVIELNVQLNAPQVLIGQNGQTLFEIERILRIILNKKTQKFFYLSFDINNYKKNKVEYLKNLAEKTADEAFLAQKKIILPPMPAYQRRVIHIELAKRQDIIAESQGDGVDRCVVIKPAIQ